MYQTQIIYSFPWNTLCHDGFGSLLIHVLGIYNDLSLLDKVVVQVMHMYVQFIYSFQAGGFLILLLRNIECLWKCKRRKLDININIHLSSKL